MHNKPHRSALAALVVTLGLSVSVAACGSDTKPRAATPTVADTHLQLASPTSTAAESPPIDASIPATTTSLTLAEPATTTTEAPPASTLSNAPNLAALAPQLRTIVEQFLAANPNGMPVPATGALLGIRAPGQPDLVVALGVDGPTGSPPLTTDGTFLASFVSARFTTMVAIRLIDEGLLDPTATLDQWVPEYPLASQITVEMLLDGTSGMPNQEEVLVDSITRNLARDWTPREVLAEAAKEPTVGPPGTFDVTTNGPGLGAANVALALIIETVTGTSLDEAIDKYLSQPLGLQSTSIFTGETRPADLQDGIFDLNGAPADMRALPNLAYMSFGSGAWGVTTTISDLLTFTESVANGKLLGPDTTARSLGFDPNQGGGRNFYVGRGLVNGYCVCNDATSPLDVRAIGFRGGSVGSSTFGLYAPQNGITIAYHANADGGVTVDLQRAIFDLVTGG